MQLVNSIYIPPFFDRDVYAKKENNIPERLVLLTKSNHLEESKLTFIKQPKIDFYITKNKNPSIEFFRDIDELEKHECRYLFRDFSIAKTLGIEKEYILAKESQQKYEFIKTMIHNNPRLFYGDIGLENHYKIKFNKKYGINYYKLRKSFLDIEIRTKDRPEAINVENPIHKINLITYVTNWDKQAYFFILYDRDDPQIKEIYNNKKDFLNWLKNEEDFGDLATEYNYIINFYKNEKDLLIDFWKIFNTKKADFCGIWNISFDIQYIINKMRYLGLNVLDHASHKDFGDYKYQEFKEEKVNNNKVKPFHRLLHWYTLTNYTQFVDMISLYSNIRVRTIEKSYKLDYITEKHLGNKKISLLEKYGCTIKDIEFVNFKVFLKYGMKDTLLLDKLEEKVNDIDSFLLFSRVSPLKRAFNASITIKDDLCLYLLNQNKIIGCNTSYDKNMYDSGSKIPGALVADPKLLNAKGIDILGKSSYIFNNVVDFDQKSQYPFVMIVWNIMKDTLYGRIDNIIKEDYSLEKNSGEEFNQMLMGLDVSIQHLCEEYLNLPKIDELINMLEKSNE